MSETTESLETSYRKSIGSLDMRRKALESESQALYLELTTPPDEGIPPMGVDTPLVDADGYPRGDVDIYRARTLRGRFQIIQTDHRELMKQTEHLLIKLAALKNPHKVVEEKEEYSKRTALKPKPKFDAVTGKWVVMNWDGTVAGVPHGDQRRFESLQEGTPPIPVSSLMSDLSEMSCDEPNTTTTTAAPASSILAPASVVVPISQQHLKQPFARVDAIAAESPAHASGLLEEDLIVEFGHLHQNNHNHLRAIAELVPTVAAATQSISLTVRRRRQKRPNNNDNNAIDEEWKTLTLSLSPKPWPGRGLIGCHLVPYTD